ncbi:MAG: glycosyltransferase family 9 protein [Ignavibacteriaceae bacterium]|nr:glycosyltransferase family 9 protein [Ignavibacteriaceae bacterium]
MNITNCKHILIVRLSSLGDILLTTPLIRSLKKQNPALQIDFVVRSEYSDLLKFNPHISSLFLFSRNDEENKKLKLELMEMKYDCVIDLQNNLRSKFFLNSITAESISFNKKRFEKVLLVHMKINLLKDASQIPVRYAETIPSFQLDNEGLDLFLPENISSRIPPGKNVIGLCPGARHFTKRWQKENFIQLGKIINEEGFSVALFGGKSDRELCEEISKEITGSIDLSTDDDILQLAKDMQQCKAIVCNDSGLMHAACAVKTPVVAIYGSTVREFGFTPYGCKNIILENNSLTCRPCSHIGKKKCPQKHFRCMLELTPRQAFESIIKALKQ